MAWEKKQRGGLYYRRSVRSGGRVTKEYLGCGPLAELVARNDLARRERQAEARIRVLVEAREADANGNQVAEFCAAVDRTAHEIGV